MQDDTCSVVPAWEERVYPPLGRSLHTPVDVVDLGCRQSTRCSGCRHYAQLQWCRLVLRAENHWFQQQRFETGCEREFPKQLHLPHLEARQNLRIKHLQMLKPEADALRTRVLMHASIMPSTKLSL